MFSEDDVGLVFEAAKTLQIPVRAYREDDFITNLFVTVIDFQMRTSTVNRALDHYRRTCLDEIRALRDLMEVLARYPDDQVGNTELALQLWGYRLWTRAGLLRRLVEFFDGVGVRDGDALRVWAGEADFRRDFEGRVKGLGRAVFQSLVMRQGVDTVKPDVHLHRFVEAAVGRRLNDADTVEVMALAAQRLGVTAAALDGAIWENGVRGSR